MVGAEAIEPMLEALDGTDNRIRARVMPLIAAVQDPRGREPLLAMLLDRNARIRLIAARCLARFPGAETVAALQRSAEKEKRKDVRKAAISSLIEQFSAGQDGALKQVVNVLLDPREIDEIRIAAFALLPHLPLRQQRGIVKPLCEDSSVPLRKLARRFGEDQKKSDQLTLREVHAWIERLADDDYVVWNGAVQKLSASGERVVDPLIDQMCLRATDPVYCCRAAIVLKSLGPRRCRARIAAALDRVDEPLPLQSLIEVIAACGDRALTYRLKDLIDRLSDTPLENLRFDPCLRVRSKAHLALANIGSRVAIADLRETLNRTDIRAETEMLDAVARVGKKDELSLLLRLWLRSDAFLQPHVAETVRRIMRRERIRRNATVFKSMTSAQRAALTKILPAAKARTAARRTASKS